MPNKNDLVLDHQLIEKKKGGLEHVRHLFKVHLIKFNFGGGE